MLVHCTCVIRILSMQSVVVIVMCNKQLMSLPPIGYSQKVHRESWPVFNLHVQGWRHARWPEPLHFLLRSKTSTHHQIDNLDAVLLTKSCILPEFELASFPGFIAFRCLGGGNEASTNQPKWRNWLSISICVYTQKPTNHSTGAYKNRNCPML